MRAEIRGEGEVGCRVWGSGEKREGSGEKRVGSGGELIIIPHSLFPLPPVP